MSWLNLAFTATSLTVAKQTLRVVWPFPGLVHYIYILGALAPGGILLCAEFSLRPSVAFYGITKLSQRAPPVFGTVAKTFGVGPHSSFM